MAVNYKDISELTEETNITGAEKVPVSGTKYVLFNKIKDWIINSLKTTGLDLGGKDIKNGGFKTFETLPTTFQGMQITFGGKVYTWNVTEGEYKCDAETLGGQDANYYRNITNLIKPNYLQGSTPELLKPLFDVLRGDKTSFLPADQIIIEHSIDGGVTWTDAAVDDTTKRRLFTGQRPQIYIPLKNGQKSCDCYLRITITAMKFNQTAATGETDRFNHWTTAKYLSTERYCSLENGWIWLSDNGDNIWMRFERSTGANPNSWSVERECFFAGFDGGNYFSLGGSAFGGFNTSQSGNNWHCRMTFRTCSNSNTFNDADLYQPYLANKQSINHIKLQGSFIWISPNNLANKDHLYSWDEYQNSYFPASVQSNETINFDASIEPTQTGTSVVKTSTWLWQSFAKWIKWLRSNSWIKSGSWVPTSLSYQSATRLLGITSPDGEAEFGLAYLNGRMYPYADGKFYQNEGAYEVLDTSDIGVKILPFSVGGTVDVDSVGLDTKLFAGSTGSWLNKGPSVDNAGALLNILTHPGSYCSQLWFSTSDEEFFLRSIINGTILSWKKIWHEGNFDPGSKAEYNHLHTGTYETPANVNSKIETAINNALSSLLTYKGSKATFGDLPVSGNKIGDTWNVQAAYFDFPAGTNFSWDGIAWDGLGGIIGLVTQTVAGLMSAADKTKLDGIAANAISAITKAMVEAVLTGTITSHTHLGLIRVSQLNPLGLLHWDDFVRFDRQADYAQVTLEQTENIGEEANTMYINFTTSTEMHLEGGGAAYQGDGIISLSPERIYEVMINVQLWIEVSDAIATVELINYDDDATPYVIKSVSESVQANKHNTIALTCICTPSERLKVRVTKNNASTIMYIYGGKKTWFGLHEIK